MTRIVIDETLRSRLQNLAQPVEFCDETGQVFGRFLPTVNPQLYEDVEPKISAEEIQRRKQNMGKTYSTAEVLAGLAGS